MCGIVGYTGKNCALPVLIKGLERLEYRGYDSVGIALSDNEKVVTFKQRGKVSGLSGPLLSKNLAQNTGIGHTRWATHGVPDDVNAHPHTSMRGEITIVHNGIVENYSQIRTGLASKGYEFKSQTDTEILANLIEFYLLEEGGAGVVHAIERALQKVVGAFGIAILSPRHPLTIFVARRGSPLAIGLGEGENFVSSDPGSISDYVSKVVFLNDNEMGVITPDSFTVSNIYNNPVSLKISSVETNIGNYEKEGFEHFMLKEIYEQPNTISETFRGRLNPQKGQINLGGLRDVFPRITKAKRIIIIGCGTSYHAAMIGEYLIEEFARINTEVDYASEFRYRNPVIGKEDVIIAISQSGETADTLAAVAHAKKEGALVLGICNVAGSTLSRETEAGVYTHAGMEIGVASTKAFTAQVTVLAMIAFKLAECRKTVDREKYLKIIEEFAAIPSKIEEILENKVYDAIASKYKDAMNALYLGRGTLFPVALEGALKLKEISYIHAEGYASGEMKHGPIALIDDNIPVIVIAPHDSYYEKILSNIQEVKARRGNVIAIVNKGDTGVSKLANDVIEIPACHPALLPLLAVVPLQMLAYKIALLRGCDVDQPRNLAKSVTVE